MENHLYQEKIWCDQISTKSLGTVWIAITFCWIADQCQYKSILLLGAERKIPIATNIFGFQSRYAGNFRERYSSFYWFCRHWWETTYQKKCEQGKNAQFQMVSLINGLLILIYSVIIRKSTLDFHNRIDLNMEGILVKLLPLLSPQIASTHTHTSHFPK